MIHLPSVSSPEYTNTHTPLTSALSTTFHQWEGSAQQDMSTCSLHVDMQQKHDYTQACAHSDMLSLAQLFPQSTRHFSSFHF